MSDEELKNQIVPMMECATLGDLRKALLPFSDDCKLYEPHFTYYIQTPHVGGMFALSMDEPQDFKG